MEIIIPLAIAVVLFLTGAPIFVAMGLGAVFVAMWYGGFPLSNIADMCFNSINSYPLLAAPFFILAGNLLVISGAMKPVFNLIDSFIGHLPGGVGLATVIAGAFFGALSGSSIAGLAILGTIMLPLMIEAHYPRSFGAGLCTVAGGLGLIIPPSLTIIIYCIIVRTSIAQLFMAGMFPGLLAAFFMAIAVVIIATKRRFPLKPVANWRRRRDSFVKGIPGLLMPVIILGGIYSGIFTPTEAAVVAIFYSLLLGAAIYRKLTLPKLREALVETAKITSMVYLLVLTGDLLGKMLGLIQLPQQVVALVTEANLGPISFLLMTELLLLILGTVISSAPMVIVVLPLFFPAAMQLGINPLQFGIIGIIACVIGECTPPVGLQLYVAVPITKERMEVIAKESWPYLVALALTMICLTFVPELATFLPGVMVD